MTADGEPVEACVAAHRHASTDALHAGYLTHDALFFFATLDLISTNSLIRLNPILIPVENMKSLSLYITKLRDFNGVSVERAQNILL